LEPVFRGFFVFFGRIAPSPTVLLGRGETYVRLVLSSPGRTVDIAGAQPGAFRMIVVMKPHATASEIDHITAEIERLGLKAQAIVGTERTVIAAIGEKRDGAKQSLETCPGVEKVMPILAPYKMASTEVKKDPTCVEVLKLKVGAGKIGVIAVPCSVESREQILEVAQAVREAGATALRAGALKPRTSPYRFHGLKGKGWQLV